MQQFSTFNFIALIAILLFSLMLIAVQPKGKFAEPPVPPETQSVLIQSNENLYFYGAGRLAKIDAKGIKYFHNDYLGTPRVETSANKNIVASNNQYPFGEKLSQQGTEKYIFTGKESDNSGLMYFGARFYVSEIGRFTQVDPVGVGYYYTNNNPFKFIDSTGKQDEHPFTVTPLDMTATPPDSIIEVTPPSVSPQDSASAPQQFQPLPQKIIDKILKETPPERQEEINKIIPNLVVVPDSLLDPRPWKQPFHGMPVLERETLEKFLEARKTVEEKTGTKIYMLSGFRTFEEQTKAGERNKFAKEPGTSLHESGTAIDIVYIKPSGGFINIGPVRKILEKQFDFKPARQRVMPQQTKNDPEFRHFEYQPEPVNPR